MNGGSEKSPSWNVSLACSCRSAFPRPLGIFPEMDRPVIVQRFVEGIPADLRAGRMKSISPPSPAEGRTESGRRMGFSTQEARNVNVGRNAPCPCGSGKKYKKCCLLAEQPHSDQSAARTLSRCSNEAAEALLEHAHATWGDGFLAAAWGAFWGDEGPADVDRDSPYVPLLLTWAIYQWIPEESAEQPSGGTVAASFLEAAAWRVDVKTRRFIEAGSSEALTFWQAASVDRGKGLLLRDMATGRECYVHERSATETVEKWDIVFGQVVGLDGVYILNASPPYVLPAAQFRRTVEESLPKHADPALLLQCDVDFIDTYLSCVDELFHPTRPDFRNTDGDRIEWTTST